MTESKATFFNDVVEVADDLAIAAVTVLTKTQGIDIDCGTLVGDNE